VHHQAKAKTDHQSNEAQLYNWGSSLILKERLRQQLSYKAIDFHLAVKRGAWVNSHLSVHSRGSIRWPKGTRP